MATRRKKTGLIGGFWRWWTVDRIANANKRAKARKKLRDDRAKAQFQRAQRQMDKKGVPTMAQQQAEADTAYNNQALNSLGIPTWLAPGPTEPVMTNQGWSKGPANANNAGQASKGGSPIPTRARLDGQGWARCPVCGKKMPLVSRGRFSCCGVTGTRTTNGQVTLRQDRSTNPRVQQATTQSPPPAMVGGRAAAWSGAQASFGVSSSAAQAHQCGQPTRAGKACRHTVRDGRCAAGHRSQVQR